MTFLKYLSDGSPPNQCKPVFTFHSPSCLLNETGGGAVLKNVKQLAEGNVAE